MVPRVTPADRLLARFRVNKEDVNISAILDNWQQGYDKRLRPNYGGRTDVRPCPMTRPPRAPLAVCGGKRGGTVGVTEPPGYIVTLACPRLPLGIVGTSGGVK